MHFFKTPSTILAALALTSVCQAAPASLVLPTENSFLETGKNEQFYTYVNRSFEGESSKPWTGGAYGFVRNKIRCEDGVICTKFHEGVDITPLRRDSAGEPLDPVKAISKGVIAYTNPKESNSSYGKYVVIEHTWDSGPIYSLYAHLSETSAKAGNPVSQKEEIGILGHTGVGLDRTRSHLHLELSLLLSTRFQEWYEKHYKSYNHHGIHSGINMAGLDFAAFYLAKKSNPELTLSAFVKTMPVHYKVTVPRKGELEILSRYPWLAEGDLKKTTSSWELCLSNSGFPISIKPSNRTVKESIITFIHPCKSKHENHTKKFVTGTGNRASLTSSGKRYIELITGDF